MLPGHLGTQGTALTEDAPTQAGAELQREQMSGCHQLQVPQQMDSSALHFVVRPGTF
jgi:hypothetical protein